MRMNMALNGFTGFETPWNCSCVIQSDGIGFCRCYCYLFFFAGVVALGAVDIPLSESSPGDEGPIANVTADQGGITVSFVADHDADSVGLRHEYDDPFDEQGLQLSPGNGPEMESAPRFDGRVTFDADLTGYLCTGVTSSEAESRYFPTDTFVVAALDGTNPLDAEAIQTVEVKYNSSNFNC